jgi:hypothetical protein
VITHHEYYDGGTVHYPNPYLPSSAVSEFGEFRSSTALHLPSTLLDSPYYSQPPSPGGQYDTLPHTTGTYAGGYQQGVTVRNGPSTPAESTNGDLVDGKE